MQETTGITGPDHDTLLLTTTLLVSRSDRECHFKLPSMAHKHTLLSELSVALSHGRFDVEINFVHVFVQGKQFCLPYAAAASRPHIKLDMTPSYFITADHSTEQPL